jgi:hypothetical protein
MVAVAGTAVIYNTTVTNNDSIGCAQTSFAMTANGSGLTGSFQTAVLTLPPGGSDTTGMNVQASTGLADGSYQLTVRAADQTLPVGQHEGVGTAVLQVDTQPPAPPSNLSASLKKVKGKQAVQLTWSQAVDAAGGTGVASYNLYRDNVLLGDATSTSFVDRNYSAGATNTYAVFSVDRVGHRSLTGSTTTFTGGSVGGPKGRK